MTTKKDRQGSRRTKKGRIIRIRKGVTINRKSLRTRRNSDNFSDRVNQLYRQEKWEGVIKAVESGLKIEPNNHWLLTQLASAYYEKKDYDTAYKFIIDAVLYKPDCPLALWHMGNIFRMKEKKEDAIVVWEEIIKRGAEEIAHDECGEGLSWARSLVNDSKYMISKTYKELGNDKQAKSFRAAYRRGISKGIKSIYDPSTL